MRANFDPTIGPARLIYAFEAVIIGGLGSFWGTLAGGIIIGLAQTIGAAHQSGMADPRRPPRLSGRARAPAARPVPARGRLKARWPSAVAWQQQGRRAGIPRSRRATRGFASPAVGRRSWLVLARVLALLPAFAGRSLIQDLIFIFYMLALAQYWNLLAGYAGLVSVGQQAFVGLGAYVLFALTHLRRPRSARSRSCSRGACRRRCCAVPTAFVVFRLRGAYFAIGTWVVAEVYRLVLAQLKQLGGGTGTSLPPAVTNDVAGIEWVKTRVRRAHAGGARHRHLLGGARAGRPATLAAVYCILRSRRGLALLPSATPRSRPRASASTISAPSSGSMCSPPSAPAWSAR